MNQHTLSFDIAKSNILKANGGQGDKFANAAKVKHLRSLAYLTALNALNARLIVPAPKRSQVTVTVHLPKRANRFDPPNYYPIVKPLIDGMTDAGVFVDDDSKHIVVMSFTAGEPTRVKGTWRITIQYKPIPDNVIPIYKE